MSKQDRKRKKDYRIILRKLKLMIKRHSDHKEKMLLMLEQLSPLLESL